MGWLPVSGPAAASGLGAKSEPGAADACRGAACQTASGRTRGGTRLLVRLPLTCGVGMAAHGNSEAGSCAGSQGGEPETGTCRTVGRGSAAKAGLGPLSGVSVESVLMAGSRQGSLAGSTLGLPDRAGL